MTSTRNWTSAIRHYCCRLVVGLLMVINTVQAETIKPALLKAQTFTDDDAVLISDSDGQVLYQWRADQAMIPASLTKLATTYLAIEKWGLEHRFKTQFYIFGTQLWVKGYGDPYLVSEELDLVADQLREHNLTQISSIHIDANYFSKDVVPGRSDVNDPYNAPISAVAANFNTAMLKKTGGQVVSAEPQTPLTATARGLATSIRPGVTRINLINVDNAQRNFAELLILKLDLVDPQININQTLPTQARLIYQHTNSRSLQTVLQGAMKYSNNFVTNQVFLKLAEDTDTSALNFNTATRWVRQKLKQDFAWPEAVINEGAGLDRQNRLSAKQIDELLVALQPHQRVLATVPLSAYPNAVAYAKTGTLDGVSNYAGFINIANRQYRFVFLFNRLVDYRYRDKLLQHLARQLSRL